MRTPPTILFVEDNEAVRGLLARVLELAGYEVLQASNAEDARLMLRDHQLPDMIITDVIMAGEGVMGIRNQLHEIGRAVPFLVISGYPFEHVIRELCVARAEFLQKPFTPQALLSRVALMLPEGVC